MTFTNIQPGIQFIEGFMVDQCLITRDIHGVLNDTLNTSTGVLERPAGDTEVVYAGICNVRSRLPRERPPQVYPGEGEHEFRLLQVFIPMAVTNVLLNDVFTVTASANDPRLLANFYLIADIGDGTLKTHRILLIREFTYMVKPED